MEDNVINLSKEIDVRKQKIKDITNAGILAYADKFDRTHTLFEAKNLPDGTKVKVCGRIISKRMMGKLGFFHIADINADMQISIGRNEINEEEFAWFKQYIDNADFIGIEGEIYHTHTNEITVRTLKYKLLSKALLPLPEKFHGLTDVETKYRQRYLDIISNDETKQVFITRSKLLKAIRNYMENFSFMEVETPILQSAVSGAAANPFLTYHKALDKECNLRIAFETYLKIVLAAGVDRVYEMGKDFRNEGMDPSHLQEFTMIEWYAAYWNLDDNIRFFQDFIRTILLEVKGTTKITYQGHEFDFGKEWDKIDYVAKMNEILGFDILNQTQDSFIKEIKKRKILNIEEFNGIKSLGGCIDLAYKKLLRPSIIEPTFLYNYPACLKPLARPNDDDSRRVDVFQVLVNGAELCNAYSELIDPQLQRQRLEEQALAKKQGDCEAMELDEDFLLAMEHGMPPMSGLGMGIDRLMAIICNQESVRDVVLFPIMK